jgi:hypothetical protein
MVSEVRHIVFSSEELMQAIVEYCRASKTPLPAGDVIGSTATQAEDSNALQVALIMRQPPNYEDETVKIENRVVGAALLRYCISKKVPMPRAASKSLELKDGEVALTLSLKAGK